MVEEIRADCDTKSLPRQSENRAIPLKNNDLEMTRRKFLKLQKPEENKESMENETKVADDVKPEKTVQRRMYDLLFSPIEDILSRLPKEGPLIIVPDKALCHCPFNLLQDFLNRYCYKRFRITYLPSLLVLDKVVANELNHLRLQDDLDFERQINRKGGILNATNRFATISGMASPQSGVSSMNISPLAPGSYNSSLDSPLSLHTAGPPQLDRAYSFGTDITMSSHTVTQFKQVSCQDRCLVFGNPKLPDSLQLHGKMWRPGNTVMVSAQREALNVATLLDVTPTISEEATKHAFLREVERAAIEGLIVMSPSSSDPGETTPGEESYLVTVNDILGLKVTAQLAGNLVTTALISAIAALRDDDRFKSPYFWSPFVLIGKDVHINIKEIRHAMLDQTLDQSEAAVEEGSGRAYLNPRPVLAPVKRKPENLRLDSSLKRLHTEENNRQTSLLSDDIMQGTGAVDLLKFLGYHFQARGTTLDNPYVVYPHWNKDELLIPTYDAIRALLEISGSREVVQAVCSVLPITQDNISLIIDLLSVTKHAPEIQLKVTDLSVRPLWSNLTIKHLLVAIGFHQIGMILNFNRTPEYRRTDVDESFREYLERAKTWHTITIAAQADEALDQYGRPKSSPQKVKVLPGATASTGRVPVDFQFIKQVV
ncbi:hypothetical protein MAR_033683 [Mya arenaria]|uniref:CHAT domain-containing protein n=1 Tax=Mya arenaria TaxID=6604 RepID=A0ABY7GDV3_MYAAR|nr:hypothetical protein MAR_033683 [Mya arenaria]